MQLGSLVTTGPYRWIRHPMYTSVLLGAGALALVLLMKSILEERWMREQHAAYAAYTLHSKRFLPWLF
jgi:protein-S-isoprenylcysteine O-methyltransferase Ste14